MARKRRRRPLTLTEKRLISFAFVLLWIYGFIQIATEWIREDTLQAVTAITIFFALLVLALWKLPRFRKFMRGFFWTPYVRIFYPLYDRTLKETNGVRKERVPIPWKIKTAVLDRAADKCQVCGRIGRHIHHINKDPSDNRKRNLILLCPTCHDEADRGHPSQERLRHLAKRRFRSS